MKNNNNCKKDIKFSEWIDFWLENEKLFFKESTYATYSNIIENHIKPSLGTKNISHIQNNDLQNMIFEKLNSGRLSNKKGLSLKTYDSYQILFKFCNEKWYY